MAVPGGYAGDLTPDGAFKMLTDDPKAILVDVRTAAEWSFVGVPDLSALGKDIVLAEWQSYPSMTTNPDFASHVGAEITRQRGAADTPVLFLCRSGARSRAAAIAMTAQGFARCYNIVDGFEGPPDSERHRGSVEGWKASGLPWTQS